MVTESYSTSSSSSTTNPFPCPQERNTIKPPPPSPSPHFHSSLHSVRKLSMKIVNKASIAPLPSTPRKVYQVDPSNFKQLVQKLTMAPEIMAPPPHSLSTTTFDKPSTTSELLPSPIAITPMSETYRQLMSEKFDTQPWKQSDNLARESPVGFTLSPMSHAWCSSEKILDIQPWKQSESLAIASPMGSGSSLSRAMVPYVVFVPSSEPRNCIFFGEEHVDQGWTHDLKGGWPGEH